MQKSLLHAVADTPHTYYVSKAGDSANGLSWATAWNELNKINWSVIRPGDTILLDGGSQSMVYTTTLTINKSGSPSLPITIARATTEGHNGNVILFGGRSTPLPYCGQSNYIYQPAPRAYGIVFGQSSWIVIDGMTWDGIRIYGFSTHGVEMTGNPSNDTLRNMEIYDIGVAGQRSGVWYPETNGHGVYLTGSNLTFDQMDIHDNGEDAFNTGERNGGVRNITINRSWLYVSREDPRTSGLPFDNCTHQDGYQIYDGGIQGGITIENSVIGPGLGDNFILGQPPNVRADFATVNNVTLRNDLTIGKDRNILGSDEQVQESNWVIDHVTAITTGRGIPGGTYEALFLQGPNNTVTHSIFYDGLVYVPQGLVNSEGNCQWKTTDGSALVGQTVDPQFVTDISSYNYSTPFATLAHADYSLQPTSTCKGAGSSITSVAQFLSMVDPQA